ncbi:MAG: hypothetical protein ABI128_15375, partial [Rhodanobacter sp.]
MKLKSKSQSKAPVCHSFALDLGLLKSAAHDGPLLYRGPCAAVRDGRQARRVIGRDANHFSPGQDALSKSPAGA